MVRTQIQLTEGQARAVKRLAAARGVSMATVIREAIEEKLAADSVARRRQAAIATIGAFRSRLGDLSENHDKYLADDFA